jgi:hypothetical protein
MERSTRLSRDTTPEAEEIQIGIYRRMPAWRKLRLVDDANRTAAALAMAGLRSRHAGESEARLRRRLLGLTLGEDLATRVYGPLQSIP